VYSKKVVDNCPMALAKARDILTSLCSVWGAVIY